MMKKFYGKFLEYYENSDWWGIFRLCLLLLPLLGIVVLGAVIIIEFIADHFDSLMFFATAIVLGAGFFYTSKPATEESLEPPKASQTDSNRSINSVLFFEKLLFRGLFQIFADYAQTFHVIPPTAFSHLRDDLPSTYDEEKGCNVYRFRITSNGDTIDREFFYDLLTSKLEAKLSDGSLSLGKAVVEYGGRLYPRIYVDSVLCVAGVWHMTLIICDSQNAANYIDSKSAYRDMASTVPNFTVRDRDFE